LTQISLRQRQASVNILGLHGRVIDRGGNRPSLREDATAQAASFYLVPPAV
jgi:hypothetical protein